MRTAVLSAAVTCLLLAAGDVAFAQTQEVWDESSGGTGIKFTREENRTQVVGLSDGRNAQWACPGEPIVERFFSVTPGTREAPVGSIPIGGDGAFSYSGPAFDGGTRSPQQGQLAIDGRFDGDTAAGSGHWTVSYDGCSADSGSFSWIARCVQNCGQATTTGLTLSISASKPATVGQYVLIDAKGTADGKATVAFYIHRDGSPCLVDTGEEELALERDRRKVDYVGGGDVTKRGPFTFRSTYVPYRWGRTERLCAFVKPEDSGPRGVAAKAETTVTPRFGLPFGGSWDRGIVDNLYGITTRGRTRGGYVLLRSFSVLGTFTCDLRARIQHRPALWGRRWSLTRIPVSASGRFAFSGLAKPDNSSHYDTPLPMPWPSQRVDVNITGRFTAARLGVGRARGTIIVRSGSRRCSERFSMPGGSSPTRLTPELTRLYQPQSGAG